MRKIAFIALLLPLACDKPTIEEYEPRSGIIQGTVLYRPAPADPGNPCVAEERTGNVVITLFAADALPPPDGSSGPVNFIVIPEAQIFGSAATDGVYAAPYTMPTVAAGRYQVRAFLDADRDFHPTIDLLNQVSAGDVGGGHVDPTTLQFLEVVVEDDKITSQVTVTLGRPIPTERPAFSFVSSSSSGPSLMLPLTGSETVVLQAQPIMGANIDLKPECTAFLIQYADMNNDGTPDDANGDHLPDVFPQVIFRHQESAAAGRSVIIPGVVNPLPFQDVLAAQGAAITTTLEVIMPPVSVEIMADGSRVISPEIPTGAYDSIVISGTGQTWQLPNTLSSIAPETMLPSQNAEFTIVPGPTPAPGRINGLVRTSGPEAYDTFVFAFAASNPPPPAGTGRPLAVATINRASFTAVGASLGAPFEMAGLPAGDYILAALVDVDSDFAPLVDLLAQASGGDRTGTTLVTVVNGLVDGVVIDIDAEIPGDRPAFTLSGPTSFSRTLLPAALELSRLDTDLEFLQNSGLLVQRGLPAMDVDGDNFEDLLPRVLLTRMVDDGPAETAPSHPDGTIIPGIVDVLPFETALVNGQPAVMADRLRVFLPPLAVRADGSPVGLPPAGRYRVNLLSGTGQTWSVPNDLNLQLNRSGGPLEIQGQGGFVEIVDPGTPPGLIQGSVQLEPPPPAGDFQVVVLAFDAASAASPFPQTPLATAVVGKAAFGGGASASYQLGPLAAGSYVVRAFLDSNDDFTPWYGTMNQPNQGDVGGGSFDMNGFRVIDVNPASGPSSADVSILSAQTLPFDRPSFVVTGTSVLDPSAGPSTVTFNSLAENTPVLTTSGTFVVQWVDANGDGSANDVNGDNQPDVYPLVVAQLLDEEDPSRLDARGITIPGLVNPTQFAGFPAMDPTQTQVVLTASSVQVVFPPIASVAGGGQQTPPDGNYRITVINPLGQTWSIPNELAAAVGTPFVNTQAQVLRVEE